MAKKDLLQEREARPSLLSRAARYADEYLRGIGERHVGARASGDELRELLRRPLSADGEASEHVIDELARAAERGATGTQSGRYFGFVTGGSLPVATAADWLVSAWDQNPQTFMMSPLAAVAEQVAEEWLLQLFGLPGRWNVGFVTGCQMANFTGLLAARHSVLESAGWDVEQKGLFGAPPVHVLVNEECHRTIYTSLRMLGMGGERLRKIETDDQGRMRPEKLKESLRDVSGPLIVCAQVGNVNTGAVDAIAEIVPLVRAKNGWLHVDGAFGLWAAASDSTRYMLKGIEQADSIASDAHKWLNVPYDSGLIFTAHPESLTKALVVPVHYIQMTKGERDPRAFVPEESRRARGIPLYAALRSLGRRGVSELVDSCCRNARRMAEAIRKHRQVRVLNDVVLNQVLVQFVPPAGDPRDAGEFLAQVVAGIQNEGTCWLGTSQFKGLPVARISISGWCTTEKDIDRSAAAILGVLDDVSKKKGGK